MGDLQCLPNKGNVAFGSGKECWAFTLTRFAHIYAKKFKTDNKKMMEKLWGDNFFDAAAKKWRKEPYDENGKTLKRAFVAFIMEPVIRLARSIMEGNIEQMDKMLKSIELELKQEERKE